MPKKVAKKVSKKVAKKGATAISNVTVVIDKKPRAKKPVSGFNYPRPVYQPNQNINISDILKLLQQQQSISTIGKANLSVNKSIGTEPIEQSIAPLGEEPIIKPTVASLMPSLSSASTNKKNIPIPVINTMDFAYEDRPVDLTQFQQEEQDRLNDIFSAVNEEKSKIMRENINAYYPTENDNYYNYEPIQLSKPQNIHYFSQPEFKEMIEQRREMGIENKRYPVGVNLETGEPVPTREIIVDVKPKKKITDYFYGEPKQAEARREEPIEEGDYEEEFVFPAKKKVLKPSLKKNELIDIYTNYWVQQGDDETRSKNRAKKMSKGDLREFINNNNLA